LADLSDLAGLAASVSADLTSAGISHAISGAAAMAAHGYVRATRDIDVLVVAPSIRLPEVFEIVRRHGFVGEDESLIRSLRDRFVAELCRGTLRIEILLPVLPYHHTLVARAVALQVAGRPVPVVSLEDLVVLKLLWRRAKDVPDIHALLALAGSRFDAAYAREALASILPPDDPRHAELLDLVRRFARVST
jgi:hypothetical protein